MVTGVNRRLDEWSSPYLASSAYSGALDFRHRFFKNSYGDDDWHGPYSSETSVSLMIARQLKRELLKRDRLSDQPPRTAVVL